MINSSSQELVQQGDLASIIDEGPKKFKETLNSIIGIDNPLTLAAANRWEMQ